MAVSSAPGVHLSVKVMSGTNCVLSKIVLSPMDFMFYELLERIAAEDGHADTSVAF